MGNKKPADPLHMSRYWPAPSCDPLQALPILDGRVDDMNIVSSQGNRFQIPQLENVPRDSNIS
jgi:hypothetical protein